ncbi:DUF2163 domain-containing protein [Rhodosalinus sp. 5P4]|uniref:DUF2163 domain-containing protein n=1 Tax=Rhodosalinus sp. 5P4 TaxID=3239196 RepID=UPI003526B6EE
MSDMNPTLAAHLEGGLTTLARAWALIRTDGVEMGFTDHDRPLVFEGIAFRPDTGLSAMALQQGTGLAVDNTEALGALSDSAITEADVEAGRYDGAELRVWIVDWQDPRAHHLVFRGHIGEIRRIDGAFRAEVRGLSDALNRPLGRVFQRPCTAVLGDAACRFDLSRPGYAHEAAAVSADRGRVFRLAPLPGFAPGWFAHGRLTVLDGPAAGLSGAIKRDTAEETARVIELWEPLRAVVGAGTRLRLEAGCDKRMETCRLKFDNLLNFRGFPDIPEEDWMLVHAAQSGSIGGGSRR